MQETLENVPVESTPEPSLAEPMMIELVSDPAPNEFGGASAEQGGA